MTNPITEQFDDDVRRFLHEHGWSEQRSVSPDSWIKYWESRGFPMNEHARNILASLGGMSLCRDLSNPPPDGQSGFMFDPIDDLGYDSQGIRHYLEEEETTEFAIPASPIARFASSYLYLVTDAGHILDAHVALCKTGRNLNDALRAVFLMSPHHMCDTYEERVVHSKADLDSWDFGGS